MSFRLPLAAALAALLAVLVAPAAPASTTQESILEDEHQFVGLGPDALERALADATYLGADAIRNLVPWSRVAPRPLSSRRPTGFDGADPAAYPAGEWDRYDDLVRGAQARGLGLLLTPTTPVPLWASGCRRGSAKVRAVCRPDAEQFGSFVRALGTRYSGAYADENQGGGVLPRVTRWSIGNEPNQKGWLYPQRERRRGQVVGTAAILYRALAREAIGALRATGHGGDQILLGETAPLGSTTGRLARRSMQPGVFLRELFCLTPDGGRMTGTAAELRGCRRFRELSVSAYAHHPYTKGGLASPRSPVRPDEITIATAPRLYSLLDRAARHGRVPRGLGVYYTEFGFQTNPPDPIGATFAEQARYLNESDHIAYRDPRVKSVAQYKLIDDLDLGAFQTGLRLASGEHKPAYEAWRLPLYVVRSGGSAVRVYGQVRPAADRAAVQVEIQRAARSAAFETVRTLTVRSRKGHFRVRVGRSGGTWRLRWRPAPGQEPLFSREARPARR